MPAAKGKHVEAREPGRDRTSQDLDDPVKCLGLYSVSYGVPYKGFNVLFEF